MMGGRGAKSGTKKGIGASGGAITQKEKDAVFDYTTSQYTKINKALRDGKSGGAITKRIDSYMDKSSLKEGTVLYRGTSLEALGLSGDVRKLTSKDTKGLIGKTITDKAYMSTTTDPNVAKNFSGRSDITRGNVNVVVTVGKNKKGISVSENSNFGAKEKEVILPRGSKLKVTNVKKRMNNLTVYVEY